MSLTLNKTVFPKGGYIFTDKDRTTFRSSSWDALVEAVTSYRARNRFPAGNPLLEITTQACRRDPSACRESAPTKAITSADRSPSLRSKVLIWLSGLRRVRQTVGEVRRVGPEVMAKRVNVCKDCPHRTDLPSGCGSCADAVKLLRNGILGAPVRFDTLGVCSALAIDLPVAIAIDEAALDNPGLPDKCWRKVNANP